MLHGDLKRSHYEFVIVHQADVLYHYIFEKMAAASQPLRCCVKVESFEVKPFLAARPVHLEQSR